MVPPELLSRYARARKVVEVGAGARFATALAFAAGLPGCRVVVTDVNPAVLGAPAPLEPVVDDVGRPRRAVYEGAALLYGIRLPEELHAPAARLAAMVGADLAMTLLGDDEPPSLAVPPRRLLVGGERWHLWELGRPRPAP